MKAPITISKEKSENLTENYDLLRQEGLKYIEQLASDIWTDYNTHDPGITILEMLCYAITDLGHRTNFPVEDILAAEKDNRSEMHKHFLTATQILTSGPVTENDYRKIFIDLPNVKNAWLSKASVSYKVDCKESKIVKKLSNQSHPSKEIQLNGLYNILLELDENLSEAQKKATIREVKSLYHRNRNLCEDLNSISIVPQQEIMVCADIELENDADIETVWAQILFDLEQYLTPNIKRYSVKDLIKKGIPAEYIFEGPILKNGFIDDEELENAKLRNNVFVSDVIRVIMSVDGVEAIRELFLNYSNPADRTDAEGYKWCLPIKEGHQPVLDLTKFILKKAEGNISEEENPKSVFNFYKDLLPFVPFRDEMESKYFALHQIEKEQLTAIANTELDLPIPLGTFKNIGQYHSIQNDFPLTYGIGQDGISGNITIERVAQAKQLKAYLLFFDQVLANYFAQLSNLKNLLSADNSFRKSYFTQVVKDVKGVAEIYSFYKQFLTDEGLEKADSEQVKEFFKKLEPIISDITGEHDNTKSSDIYTKRKNKFLDHLLARFAESFNDYVMLMHQLFRKKRADQELIRDKIAFLNEYQFISQNRAKGFDYCNALSVDSQGNSFENKVWYTQEDMDIPTEQINVSGIVRRVARLAGIHNYKRRNLSSIEYTIYQEKDEDDEIEYRWRVVDIDNSKILLSSSMHYAEEAEAIREMRQSVQLSMFFENYELLETEDDRFYFNIINQDGEVVGRRIEYFTSENARLDAIEYLIDFLNEKYSEEGFYVFENILLRPRKSDDEFLPVCTEPDCTICEPIDPYSFRVSIVFPGYTPRFSNMDFRKYVEKLIRTELPAHILARICWIGAEQMSKLEKLYKNWLEYQQEHCAQPTLGQFSLNELIDYLDELYTIYPPGTLHDCEEGDDENPVILGKTHIGNQNEIIESDGES
jgi:hypothetical protein